MEEEGLQQPPRRVGLRQPFVSRFQGLTVDPDDKGITRVFPLAVLLLEGLFKIGFPSFLSPFYIFFFIFSVRDFRLTVVAVW